MSGVVKKQNLRTSDNEHQMDHNQMVLNNPGNTPCSTRPDERGIVSYVFGKKKLLVKHAKASLPTMRLHSFGH